ncbi:MAG: extracellular solute-binding protein [Anaerolineae bacterium]
MSLVLLLVGLSACVTRGGEPGEPITLTFACYHSDLSVYQAAAEAFHQSNPSIDVRIIPLDEIISFPLEDAADTLGPVRQIASRADAFLWSTDAVEGGPDGLVLDLAPFMEADGEPTEADFLPGLLAHFQWQGGTWGLPAGVDPLFILYDPAAFDATGLEHPSPGWTWDDLFDAAKQLTQREGGRVVRYGFADFGLESVGSAIEAQGGRLVDDSAGPPVPTLDDPRTVAAVQWYADLALADEVMLNPVERGLADAFTLVQGGEVAMNVLLARMWVSGARQEEGALGLAPLPDRSPVGLQGYFISAGTAHPEAVWRWLRFLSREVAAPDCLPARQNLISASDYAAVVGEEALEVFRYAAEHALPPVRPVTVERLLRQAIEQVFENREVEDALAEAQEQALASPAPRVAEPVAVPSPVPPEATVETITFVTFHRQEYVPLAEAFHEVHPDIKVIVREAVDFDYHGMWPAEMLKASDADCFWSTWSATVPELRQVALNLQLFADADPTLPLDDYLPRALEWVRHGGNLWGLPAGVNVEVLWYNRTLFDEAGLPYPENDWSWDDVFLIARRLAGRDKGGQYYGFIIWSDARIIHLFEAIGGPLVDESPAPPTFRFDTPKAVAATQQLRSLVQDEVIPIPEQSKEYPGRNLYTLIWANRVGMWAEGAKGFQSLDFHPAPLPRPSRCQRFRASSAYYIAADTPHAEACWEWLRFLSERIPDTSTLPPRHSLLTSDAFSEQVGEDAQAVYLEALECEDWIRFRGLESLPPYAEGALYTWLRQALGEILWQGADAQAALSQAQQKAEAYLDCLRQRPDSEGWETADACLQEVNAP